MSLSDNAKIILEKRYLQRDENGVVTETPAERFRSVATACASVEKKDKEKYGDEFFSILNSYKFLPAGRTLSAAGTQAAVVPNCIVLHIPDSMDGIFSTLRDAALLQKAGSGLGFPFHLLRPYGFSTKGGDASGPATFIHSYNASFGVIKQNNRHGANMGICRIDHPDVLEFMALKKKEGTLKNFNISIALTDKFMSQVITKSSDKWVCEFEGVQMKPRRFTYRPDGTVDGFEEMDLTAGEIFNELVELAWNNGEPGVVFIDTVNHSNPLPGIGRLECCNPCGEQFLHDSDVCNLGSINLDKFIRYGKVNWEDLKSTVFTAVRMLDNVIDITRYPVDRVKKMSMANRRVGLGVMGFADLLYQMNIPYNSIEGRKLAEEISDFINESAKDASIALGEEKGVFPNWDKSKFKADDIKRRNAAVTTIAPTGTTSIVADVSGGLEPYFALYYHYKEVLGGKVPLENFNRHLRKRLDKLPEALRDTVMKEIKETGSIQGIETDHPELQEIKRVFVTANDISPEDHIKMQSAFQRHVENSVSKTINLPNDATKDDISHAFILAHELGLKGMTVYRDGSRQLQTLNVGDVSTDTVQETPSVIEQPDIAQSRTVKIKTDKGNAYVTICIDENDGTPYAVFAYPDSDMESPENLDFICRLISLALRSGIPKKEIVKQAYKSNVKFGGLFSTPKRISEALEKVSGSISLKVKCPECRAEITLEEGCVKCHRCGYSRC